MGDRNSGVATVGIGVAPEMTATGAATDGGADDVNMARVEDDGKGEAVDGESTPVFIAARCNRTLRYVNDEGNVQ